MVRRSEEELFLDAVAGTVPLPDRSRTAAQRPPRKVPAPASAGTGLVQEAYGGSMTARRPNVNRRLVRELAAGQHRPDASLDLHRMTADDARARLDRFLCDSARDGHRCVLVVVGRGTHSAGGGVLRPAVLDWVSGPLSREVLAIASATPRDGGDGAYYVYLRKP